MLPARATSIPTYNKLFSIHCSDIGMQASQGTMKRAADEFEETEERFTKKQKAAAQQLVLAAQQLAVAAEQLVIGSNVEQSKQSNVEEGKRKADANIESEVPEEQRMPKRQRLNALELSRGEGEAGGTATSSDGQVSQRSEDAPGVGKRPRKGTWLFTQKDPNKPDSFDAIFFYSHSRAHGGPFDFLSNFYNSPFRDPQVHKTHRFNSMEQYYQYVKAKMIGLPEEKLNLTGLSSKDLYAAILMLKEPGDMAWLGRSFNFIRDADWQMTWRLVWHAGIDFMLERGLFLKFSQNPELKEKLMKTGNFPIYNASEKDEENGIGWHAMQALDHQQEWGKNRLGIALQKVREYTREMEPGKWPEDCDVEYFKGIEDAVWKKRAEAKAKKSQEQIKTPAVDLTQPIPSREESLQIPIGKPLPFQNRKRSKTSRKSDSKAAETSDDAANMDKTMVEVSTLA